MFSKPIHCIDNMWFLRNQCFDNHIFYSVKHCVVVNAYFFKMDF